MLELEPIGKTYLIQGQLPKEEVKKGIILPVFGTNKDFASFMGTIIGYGTGFTQEEKKDLIPIGTKVIIDYSRSVQKTKIYSSEKVLYIYKKDDILALVEQQQEN